jgi:hypothetical protein
VLQYHFNWKTLSAMAGVTCHSSPSTWLRMLFRNLSAEASNFTGNKKNVQKQDVDVDKNPLELPGESLYDKETREAEEILAEEGAARTASAKLKRKPLSRH